MESIKELREICQKPMSHIGTLFTRYFIRKISIYFTKLFLLLGLTANQVTLLSLVVGLAGAILFFTGNLISMLVGALMLIFAFVLDHCDGEVARYYKKIALTGVHIDQVTHQIVLKFVYFGLTYGVYLNTQKLSVLIFGFLCTIFSASIVFNTLSLELVKIGVRSKDKDYDYIKKYKKKVSDSPFKLAFGETKGKLNFLYGISATIKFLWTDPYDKLIILFLIIIEVINTKLYLFPSFSILYYFIIIYGVLFTLIQLFSFIIHIRSKTIEQYYSYLFGRK